MLSKKNQLIIFESLRKSCKSESEQLKLHDAIFKSLHETIIVIDQATEGIRDIVGKFPDVRLLEFTSYVEDVNKGLKSEHVHIFEPYYELEAKKPRVRKEVPEIWKDWGARLEWAGPNIKGLAAELIDRVEKELPGIAHKSAYRWYIFYNSKEMSGKAMFLTLMIGKKKITASICVDPKLFKDKKNWVRDVKGWFFSRPRRQEKRFSIESSKDLNYAMKLIKQSYDFSLEA